METIQEEDETEIKMSERETLQVNQNLKLDPLKEEQERRNSSIVRTDSDNLRESKTYQESFRYTKLNESLLNAIQSYQDQNEKELNENNENILNDKKNDKNNSKENNNIESNSENKININENNNNDANQLKIDENNKQLGESPTIGAIKEYKVVVLGDYGVGKTSLIYRYMHNKFKKDIKEESEKPENHKKKIQIDENLKIRLNIWDTADMEKNGKIFKQYYKDIYGALIIFDITNKESFNNAKNWLEELKENSPKDIVFCFLGNKSDLDNERQISYEEIKEYTGDNLYYEVSSKSGNNVSLAFESLAYNIVEKQNEEENNPDKVIRGTQGRKTTDLKEFNEKDLKKKKCC